MLTIREYKKVQSLEEAWELNQKRANRVIGGMMWMRLGDSNFQTAIDLSGLGLDTIEETEDEFRIGCMVTLRQLETHPGFVSYTQNMCKESLRHIVGVQFRNLATVGGSIYGRYGFSDVLTLLIGLDSYVELYKGGMIPLREFAKGKPDNDILVQIIIKKHPVAMYYEAVRIMQTDLPVLTCCGVHDKENGSYTISIGARPGRAVIVPDDKLLLKGKLTTEAIEVYARYAAEVVPTDSNMRGSREYRSHLVEVLSRRALEYLCEEESEAC